MRDFYTCSVEVVNVLPTCQIRASRISNRPCVVMKKHFACVKTHIVFFYYKARKFPVDLFQFMLILM